MSSLLIILLSAVLVCHYAPLLMGARAFEQTDSFSNAVGMSVATLLMLSIVAPLSYIIERVLLLPLAVDYLRTLALIIVIMTVAQLLATQMSRLGPWTPVRPVFVMLMTAHCGVLGVALLATQLDSFPDALGTGLGTGLAFSVLLLAFTTLHARVQQANVPLIFRDVPIALVSMGLTALALMGLTGLIRD